MSDRVETEPVVIEVALNGVTSRRRNPHVPRPSRSTPRTRSRASTRARRSSTRTRPTSWSAPRKRPSSTRPRSGRWSSSIRASSATRRSASARRSKIATATSSCSTTWGSSRQGAVDTGSVNLGGTGRDGLPPASEFVYTNTFAKIALRDAGVHAHAVSARASRSSSPASCSVVLAYAGAGALPPGTLVKFYFAGGGYLGGGDPLWGAPPIIEALDLYLAMLGDAPVAVGGRGARRLAARHAHRARRARTRRPPARRHRGLGRRSAERRAGRGRRGALRRGRPPGRDQSPTPNSASVFPNPRDSFGSATRRPRVRRAGATEAVRRVRRAGAFRAPRCSRDGPRTTSPRTSSCASAIWSRARAWCCRVRSSASPSGGG